MSKILKWANDNHWYIIAIVLSITVSLWIYGCESEVKSMIDPTKKINRAELKLESEYLIGQLQIKLTDLDKQDELKMLLLEQAMIFGSGGQFNPAGLLNTIVSIGAISFGLNRNQKLKKVIKDTA